MKKVNILILALASLMNFGCSDMLDLTPQTDVSDGSTWNKAKDFEKGVNRFYEWLPRIQNNLSGADAKKEETWYKAQWGIGERDKQADLFFGNTPNPISNSSQGLSQTDMYYTGYYYRLRAINYLFKNAENYSNKEEIKQYIAEARFFRAYYSYLFFIDFGPGVIVRDVMEVSSPELYEKRATREDFSNFIIEDLEYAIKNGLPDQLSIADGAQYGRITKEAAQALMTRVCLFEGTWQKYHYNNLERSKLLLDKVVANAEELMKNTYFKLFYDERLGAESYRYMFILENTIQSNLYNILKEANKEYIFFNRFSEVTRQSNQNISHTSQSNHMMGSRKIIEMHLNLDGTLSKPDYETSLNSWMKGKDPRLACNFRAILNQYFEYSKGRGRDTDGIWVDNDSLQITALPYRSTHGFQNGKFVTERYTGDAYGDGFDVPLIRLAEVYLNFAEAKCELDGTVSEPDLNRSVNLIRKRVHMSDMSESNIPVGSTLLNEIRRERAIEFWREGLRYDDLRRWKIAEKEMSKDIEGVPHYAASAYRRTATVKQYNGRDVKYTPMNLSNLNLSSDGFFLWEATADRQFGQRDYLRPIPTKQLELNPNLEQNSGWEE